MEQRLGQPYWWEDGAQLPDLPIVPPNKAELLIIGAGYTGLSAAITAANAGAQVMVVDAGIPGQGASTRNGGMAGAHPRLSLADMAQKFGQETARGMFNEAPNAFSHLRHLIESYNIECDYQQTGRIQLAWTKAHFASQQALAADMNSHTDFRVEVVKADELGAHLSTKHYFGGLLYKDHGAVQPRKLHDGLMKAALDTGVQVVQNCPIGDVIKTSGAYEASWNGGVIQADKVILATNGYTQGKGIFNWVSRRVFPVPSYLIATEQLPAEMINELAPAGRMMVETRARHSYWRISPDGTRVIWGGRASICQIDIHKAARRLRQTMTQIWPQLKDVKITHAWSGNTGFSFNHSPKVGVKDGVHYALGYCGGGVVLAPYLGMKVAYHALGDSRGITAYSQTELTSKPYYLGGSPWFLRPANIWYSTVTDTLENKTAARDHHSKQG